MPVPPRPATFSHSFAKAASSIVLCSIHLSAALGRAPRPQQLATAMFKEGLLTDLQARLLLKGKWRNFILCGKYKILEPLGTGGMGHVYLCEHIRMHKLVAVKILDADKSADDMLVKLLRAKRAGRCT